ncbi:MAG: hypoxanthine phosphoribosyltransferase [Candidatus Sericytochromatia bacterium]|nr:MAG: hypoxanthine phosphoribosyltransferase [Candidatus Sericytochromatia bacterium]
MFESKDILRIIINKEDLNKKVTDIAQQISNDYKNKDLIIICVLNGAIFFCVDLVKKLTIPVEIDYISVSSYHGTSSLGEINLIRDILIDIKDKDVLILEDILDTGITLTYLKEHILSKGPKSLKICSLLDKPSRRKKEVNLDYTGFIIDDIFIIGYGMDYNQKYRQLPYIAELKPEIYS